MGSQNEMMILTTDLTDGAFTYCIGAEVEGGTDGRDPMAF